MTKILRRALLVSFSFSLLISVGVRLMRANEEAREYVSRLFDPSCRRQC